MEKEIKLIVNYSYYDRVSGRYEPFSQILDFKNRDAVSMEEIRKQLHIIHNNEKLFYIYEIKLIK